MHYARSLLAIAGSIIVASATAIAGAAATPAIHSSAVASKYIVVLKNEALHATQNQVISALGAVAPTSTYSLGSFHGYAITADAALVDVIKAIPGVAYVEPDTTVHITALTTQNNAPKSLARLSHKLRGSTTYVYDSSAGAGTYAYILDTGIDTTHPEFGGRASFGANYADSQNNDGNGHGTHQAGLVGSTTYGAAKKANLIAVKIVNNDGSGTISGIISGIQFVVNDTKNKGRTGRTVANLSVGGSYSQSLNDAVKSAVNSGVFFAVPAGNSAVDASQFSPGSELSAFTVGCVDDSDAWVSSCNFGPLLDILAPSVNIPSTWPGNQTRSLSGSSVASAYAAGVAALVLALEGGSPAQLSARLMQLSAANATGVPANTTKKILYNGSGQ